jgi:hypothetical protein
MIYRTNMQTSVQFSCVSPGRQVQTLAFTDLLAIIGAI